MQQKKIWMHYLIIGISILTISLSGCGEGEIDYNVKADYIFINDTDYDIKYDGAGSRFNVNSRDTTVHHVSGEGPESVNENSFVSPLHTYCYPCIVRYNNLKCDTIRDNGPADISNFTSRRLGERHIEYVYRFTEQHFEDAEVCD